MTTSSEVAPVCPDAVDIPQEMTISRESPFSAWMEVYEDGEKLLDVYGMTWFPENNEWLLRQGERPDKSKGELGMRWRFRTSSAIRLTVTLPDSMNGEARINTRLMLRRMYGWVPNLEIL